MKPFYVVVVGAIDVWAQTLLVTHDLVEALRALDVVALLRPDVQASLYLDAYDEAGLVRTLRVRKERWHVELPAPAQPAPEAMDERAERRAEPADQAREFAFGGGR